jgi:flagella basal body P-ring formation protein FlgA
MFKKSARACPPTHWVPWLLTGLAAWPLLASAAGPAPAPAARVEAAARQFLQDQATLKGLVDPAFELHLATSPQPLAPCPTPVDVQALETRYLSRMRFSATCPGEGGWQRDWTVRAEVTAVVVVAAADVPANRPLTDADLAQERRKLTDMADALPAPDAAIGQASTRALRTGQVVVPRFLAQPLLIKRGEQVTIQARSGPIEVNVAGEALEPGRRGEVLRVRNSSTGKVIRARVLDSGLVEPENMGRASGAAQSRD